MNELQHQNLVRKLNARRQPINAYEFVFWVVMAVMFVEAMAVVTQ